MNEYIDRLKEIIEQYELGLLLPHEAMGQILELTMEEMAK